MRRSIYSVFFLLALGGLLLWLATPMAFAQETRGQILGRVVDQSGAVVAGAAVRGVNTGTNVETSTTTNETGDYTLPFLISGTYRVIVQMKGFKEFIVNGVQVQIAEKITLNVALQLGQQTESIQVTGGAELVEAASATLGSVINSREISELPLKDGNPIMLGFLSAGVQNLATGGWSRPFDNSAPSAMAVDGTRTATNEFTMDGAPNSQAGSVAFVPPTDAVQEFKIQTATFDASMGYTTSAVINVSLKSGTNALHGSLWEFLQNTDLAANDFFNNKAGLPRVTKDLNRWGVSLGGPLWLSKLYDGRNKTFWMYTYEGIHDSAIETPSTGSVPTPAELQGDFSALLKVGPQYAIYDPATTQPAAGGLFSRTPFPGNIIPPSQLNSTGMKIASFYTPANQAGQADGTNNWYTPDAEKDYFYTHVFRVDRVMSDKHRFFLRGNINKRIQDYKHYWNGAMGDLFLRDNRGLAIDDVYTISPTFVMNLRYSYTRYWTGDQPTTTTFNTTTLGFSPNFASEINSIDSRGMMFPTIVPSNYETIGGIYPNRNMNNTHDVAANFTKSLHGHTLRFGTGFRVYEINAWNLGAESGYFAFGSSWDNGPLNTSASSPIGQDLASLLLGQPSTSSYLPDNASYAEASKDWSAYVEDDWKVNSKLTLNLGLRYELELPTTERFNRAVLGFNTTSPSPIATTADANYALHPIPAVPVSQFQVLGGLTFAGVGGNPRGLWQINKNDWMPRIGLAYSLNSKTVVRAGFGRFYDMLGVQRHTTLQTGFSSTTSFVGSLDNGQTYVANLTNPFPNGVVQPTGSSLGLGTYMGQSVTILNPNLKTPYMQRWQISLQRELPGHSVLEIAYVGNHGYDLLASQNVDAIPGKYYSTLPVRDTATINLFGAAVNNPFYPLLPSTSLSGTTVSQSQLWRPYPQFTGVTIPNNLGYSWYNALQARFEKRMSHGVTTMVSWTWSKFIEATSYLNSFDAGPAPAISTQDRPQHVNVTGLYQLPFGRGMRWGATATGLPGKLISGWQVQGIYQIQSGAPIGFGDLLLLPGETLQNIPLPAGQRTIQAWFNTAAFNRVSSQQLSDNVVTYSTQFTGVRAPLSLNNVDLSAIKNTSITEHVRLQFHADFVNALNHPQFSPPTTSPTSSAFGTITSSIQWPRTIEFGLKVIF
jgi:hypothetical protein